ncbi:MAG TPA: primosomal protein N', partial [Flavobacterium sp.]|nr:primosomal protein N' [Flavobacterium sp.]
KNQLRCHYCGYSIPKSTHCQACHSIELTTKGFGTEQVEMELAELFPQKKISRMDQDTTGGKHGYDNLIEKFKHREIDILVGTQMLAKGLDFDNVGLVGVLNADNMLFFPDFRAFERSFQMMVQVSGRAGRSDKRGRVVIQTYNPNHIIIKQVFDNDYIGMYKEQLYERNKFQYPPFYKLIRITLKHRDFEKTRESSMWLYQVLNQNLDIPVLGPEEPAVSRIRNEYYRLIMIKIPLEHSLIKTKKTIHKILDSFNAVSQFKAVRTTINVDVY